MGNIRARIHQRKQDEIVRLGKRAIQLRDESGVSINRIAERFGVTYNAVQRWIRKVEPKDEL